MNDFMVCNVNFGNYFTSLQVYHVNIRKLLNLISLLLQKYHKIALKIGLFFINLVQNFKSERLLERGQNRVQPIR